MKRSREGTVQPFPSITGTIAGSGGPSPEEKQASSSKDLGGSCVQSMYFHIWG